MPNDLTTDALAPWITAMAGVPAALVPSSVKALNRLIGAGIDVPTAWLAQQKAKIDAQTAAYGAVEAAIAKTAAARAGEDPVIISQALDVLVRKTYQRQSNVNRAAAAAVNELQDCKSGEQSKPSSSDVDEDWLNVFERYAEDASSERMQKLWGRVLAGEIRSPGRYSMRTLRFLSEFTQGDALAFADFCENCFAGTAPRVLLAATASQDLRPLMALESAGLVQGWSGEVQFTLDLGPNGSNAIVEGNLALVMQGEPNSRHAWPALPLTPLGIELTSLLPGRDALSAARKVAFALRNDAITSASLSNVARVPGTSTVQHVNTIEKLW